MSWLRRDASSPCCLVKIFAQRGQARATLSFCGLKMSVPARKDRGAKVRRKVWVARLSMIALVMVPLTAIIATDGRLALLCVIAWA